jgi:hypothetical protein
MAAGLFHDFGGSTLSNFDLFPYFFCTSAAYTPYCPPFMLEDETGRLQPMVIGSPLPARSLVSPIGSRAPLSGELRMPVTFYFHPEFIADAVTFDELHPEFQAMIWDMEQLRDMSGYCPVTEPQAARAHIANRTASVQATLSDREIRIESDSSTIFPEAGRFRNALGVRIEYAPDAAPFRSYKTTSAVRYINPADGAMELALNADGVTRVSADLEDTFCFERINVPFELDAQAGETILRISEPGLRFIRYLVNSDDSSGLLPKNFPGTVSVHNRTLELKHSGDKPLEIIFRRYDGADFDRKLLELTRRLKDRPVDPAVLILDFGTPAARQYYKRGWCLIDEGSQNRSVTWSTGYPFSELSIPMSGSAGYSCSLEVFPFTHPVLGSQTLAVEINDRVILSPVELVNEWQTVTFEIDSANLFPGLNTLTFRYNYVSFPALTQPGSMDFRPLAVMFDRLKMVRQQGN